MKKFLIAALFALGFAAPAMADQCSSWISRESPVTMEACSYKDGGSGYYKITNTGTRPAAVCWSVISNSGKPDNGCNSNLGAGQSSTGSCFRCGSKNEGVQRIDLRSYKVAGEAAQKTSSEGTAPNRSEATAAPRVQTPQNPVVASPGNSPVGSWLLVIDDNGDKTSMVLRADGGGTVAGKFPLRWSREGSRVNVTAYGDDAGMQRGDSGQAYQLELSGAGMKGMQLPVRVGNASYNGHPITLTRQ